MIWDLTTNLLSLAVLALAVDDMNDRESVITSATPAALLWSALVLDRVLIYKLDELLVSVQLTQIHQRRFLIPNVLLIVLIGRVW